MAENKVGFVILIMTLWAINAADGRSCEGTCFPRNRCPRGYTSAGGPSGKCPGYKMKCCVPEPDRCALVGGLCFPKNRCPDGYISAGRPGKKCKGRKQKCCIPEKVLYAACEMKPVSGNTVEPVTGTLRMSQPVGGKLKIDVDLTGFDVTDTDVLHGLHAHVYGDISNDCASAGGHFDPTGSTHGGPNDAIRHVGDLGNLKEDGSTDIKATFTDRLAKLSGPHSILGRSLVLHAKKDDFMGGSAGPRIACCVIGLAAAPPSK